MCSCSTGSADRLAHSFAIIARQSRRCPWLPGLLLLLVFLSTAVGALGANPQLTPGGAAVGVPVTAQSPPSPTSGSLQGNAWSVLSPAGAVVATSGTPNGWTFPSSPSGAGTYSLAAPSGAVAGAGYTLVWYYSTSYVGNFDVVAAGPPAAPTGLTATAGNQYVSLTWAAPSGTGITYSVYRGTASGGEGATPIVSSLSGTSYTDSGVTNGTAYYYTVKAVNSAGPSPAGNEAHTTPQAVAPSAPTALTAAPGNAQIVLSWVAPAGGGLTYNVYRGTAGGGEGSSPVNGSPLGSTGYTDGGLTRGTTYYYVVRAINAYGPGPAGNEASATTPLPPSAPAGLSAAIGNARVSLTWGAVSGAASYNVKRSTTNGGPYTTAGSVTGASYTDSGLTNGTTYYYVVSAVGSGGEGANSSQASAMPAALTAAAVRWQAISGSSYPSAQSAASFTTAAPNAYDGSVGDTATGYGSSGTVNVLWDLGSAVSLSGFRTQYTNGSAPYVSAYYSTDGVNWTSAPAGPASGSQQTFSPITARYVQFSIGGSSPSVTDTRLYDGGGTLVLPPSSTPPGAPTGLTATGGSGYAALSWTAPAGSGLTYNVYRGTAAGGESATPLNGSAVTGTSYTDGTAVTGTTYYYVVRASNGLTGPASNEASAAAQAVAPNAPSGLTASAIPGRVTLAWSAPAGTGITYSVYRGTSPGGEGATPVASGLTATGYYDTGVTNGTAYYYVVRAVNAYGTGLPSNEASATPPAAPAGPAAVAVQPTSGSQATLYWSPVSGATSYNVYRSTASGAESAYGTGQTGSSYPDTGLTSGTAYFYQVTAVGPGGESARSSEATGTPGSPLQTLAAPGALKAVAGGAQVTLSWSAVSGATGYDVFRGTGSGALTLYRANVSSPALTDTGVSAGTTYSYQVATVNAYGQGATLQYSPFATVYATPGPAPLPAPLMAAQSGGSGSTSATVIWNPVAGATSYNLYRGTSAGGEGSLPVASVSGSQSGGYLTYQDTGTAGATTYYYRIAAVNNSSSGPNAGEGGMAAEASVLTGSALLPQPTFATAGVSGTTITLNWSAVAGATGYNLYRQVGGGSFTLYQVGLGGTSFADTGLTGGTTYGYYVAPVNATGQGQGSYYQAVSATAGSTPLPATLMSATAHSASVALWWNPVAGANSYNVYRSTSSGGEGAVPVGTLTSASGGGLITYSDPVSGGTALTNGTRYFYQVTAVAGSGANAGEGAKSNEASATPSASGSPLSAVPGLTVHAASGQLNLNWGAASGGASGYNLYRQVGGGPLLLYRVGVSGTSYADTSLMNGTVYGYALFAETADGQGPQANAQGSGYVYVGASGTPGGTAPAAPILSARSYGGSGVTLTWGAVPTATAYNVYRSATSGGEGLVPVTQVSASSGGSSGTSYGDPSPLSGQSFYQVTAVSSVGEGAKSNEAGISPAATQLSAPTGLTATPGYAKVTLAWNAVSGATSYNVYRAASGSSQVLIAVGLTSPTYQDGGTGPGTFTYSVAAVNANGEGAQASVTAAPNDFSLSPSPLLVTAGVGTTGGGDLGIGRSGTLTSMPVILTLSGTLPAGVTSTFFPQSPDHTGSSLYFCVGAGVAAGTYQFTLTGSVPGSPSPLTHQVPVTLTVTSP